jgi:hypothetical protein
MSTCLNCGADLTGLAKFCAQSGAAGILEIARPDSATGILAIHPDPLPIGAIVIVADDESFFGVAGGHVAIQLRGGRHVIQDLCEWGAFVRTGTSSDVHFGADFGLISDAKGKNAKVRGIGSMHVLIEDPALLVERIASLSAGIRRIDVIALVRDAAVQGTKRALGDVCSVLGWDVDDLIAGAKNEELPALFASAYAASEGALPGTRVELVEMSLSARAFSEPSIMPQPQPSAIPPPAPTVEDVGGFGPGMTVLVQRDGQSLVGTIEQTAEDGQCLVSFEDGQQIWIVSQYLSATP